MKAKINPANPPQISTPQFQFQTRNYDVLMPHHLLSAAGESPAEPIVPCLCCIRRTTGHYTRIKLVLRFHAAE